MKIQLEAERAGSDWTKIVRQFSGWCQVFLVGICLCLCCAAESWAGEKSQDLIDQASSMYGALEFEKSIELMDRALQVPGNSRQQMIRIYQVQGMCFGYLGQNDKAQRAFAQLLALDHTVQLSPDVSPRVQKIFQEAFEQIPRGLAVQLSPPAFAEKDQPLNITVQLVSDPLGMARAIRVWFRRQKSENYLSIHTSLDQIGKYTVSIPAANWQAGSGKGAILWYAVLEGENQGELQNFGEALNPLVIEVRERLAPSITDSVKKITPSTSVLATLPVGEKKKVVTNAQETSTPWYRRWWVWTLLGTALATSVAVIVVVTYEPSPSWVDFRVDVSTSP